MEASDATGSEDEESPKVWNDQEMTTDDEEDVGEVKSVFKTEVEESPVTFMQKRHKTAISKSLEELQQLCRRRGCEGTDCKSYGTTSVKSR